MGAHRRHDISGYIHLTDRVMWAVLQWITVCLSTAVFWVLRTGAPWRDLPPDLGDWKNVQHRFCRWRDRGIWEKLLELVTQDPDYQWLMIDATHIKVHPHAAGAKGGNQDMSRTKGRLNTKIHLAVDAHGMPVRILITKRYPTELIAHKLRL